MKKDEITVCIDGQKKVVPKAAYIKAKTKQLKEFGYGSLTEEQTGEALEEALKGNAKGVIALFIESDLP